MAKRKPLIIAHRGHSTGAPEQTMAAYRAAVDLGAEMIEADAQFSREGKLVMLHDAKVDRTTSGKGFVADLTWAELQRLDAGSWFGSAFAGERIPSLDALFALAEETGVALCLEAKGETPEEYLRVALAIAAEIVRRNRLGHDVLASFDHAALGAVVARFPGLHTAPDRLPEHGPSAASDLVAQARAAGATIIQHHHADLTAEAVEGVQAAGIAIWAWPTTKAADIERSLALGVDALMGDDVEAIKRIVTAAFGD